MPEEAEAFLTGSRVYGTPTEDSDWDLVVLTTDATALALHDVFAPDEPASRQGSIKVGKLNLILITNLAEYGAWRAGTEQLKARAPVTREEAIRTLRGLCGEVGLGLPASPHAADCPCDLCRVEGGLKP